jgi:hypothetical protein
MKRHAAYELTTVKWGNRDIRDKIPERFEATLALMHENPRELLPRLIRVYIESVEKDSQVIGEAEEDIKRRRPRHAKRLIERFHHFRRKAV